MSAESSIWLNTQTLIGFTLKRGNAWHYRAEDQGAESNHYPDAIPVEDVRRRLFDFRAVDAPLFTRWRKADGTVYYAPFEGYKGIVATDDKSSLGVHGEGYRIHQYDEWLLDNVATLLDSDVAIGSAGLLRGRRQAWCSVEVPENITTPEGVVFRPNLLAVSSTDGTLKTTYKRVVQNVVCDNTLAAGMSEAGQDFAVKHTRHSHLRITDARQAVGILFEIADDFAREVAELTASRVSDYEFKSLLDVLIPVKTENGVPVDGQTRALNKRDELTGLYHYDPRCAPWQGTAYGVLQTFNTYNHHVRTIRSSNGEEVHRGIRNMANAISGATATDDRKVMAALAAITA